MKKNIPRVFRTYYTKDFTYNVDSLITIPFMAGVFIESGSLKADISLNDNTVVEIIFPTNSLILHDGYIPNLGGQLIKWNFNNTNFEASTTQNWKLTGMQDDTKTLCFIYDEYYDNPSKNLLLKNKPFKVYPQIYNFHRIEGKKETVISLPKNHYLFLIKGSVFIENKEKKAKTWIFSSKNQNLKIKNEDENNDAIILLLKSIGSK